MSDRRYWADSEPGLILTPPDIASERDDGYLSASEVAGLRLDADWVILSACNTAAGNAQGADALSGLARAFFYAGARSLLVSHWSVNSDATVKLITGAKSRLSADKRMGRAEAMRQSMLALIDTGASPAYWAPFIVVGEGAASGPRLPLPEANTVGIPATTGALPDALPAALTSSSLSAPVAVSKSAKAKPKQGNTVSVHKPKLPPKSADDDWIANIFGQ